MLGSGVPVLAVSFATLPELIIHNDNGLIFKNYIELKDQLFELFYSNNNNVNLTILSTNYYGKIS